MTIVLSILVFLITLSLILFVIPNLLIAVILYRLLLVRTSKSKWTRGCRKLKGKEQIEMYSLGLEWAKNHELYKEEVSVNNGNLKLYGEFFNFGFDKAVIIIPGRSEGCTYSYYYAQPYKSLGYNVLVIDNRCNGLSDGKYLTFGIKEYGDILLWGQFLHEKYNINSILLHGICIGAATALYTLTSENIPSYYKGMIADGMYSTFYDTFVNHVVAFKQPVFPVPQIVFFMIKKISKVDAKNSGPIFSIEQLSKPILFLHTKQDKFSLPVQVQEIYNRCNSPKALVWFENGSHSHVRFSNESKYDQVITDFITELRL